MTTCLNEQDYYDNEIATKNVVGTAFDYITEKAESVMICDFFLSNTTP